MNQRLSMNLAILSAALLVGGCGPTKTGIENREAARAQLDAFNAHLTYQQAEQSFQVGELEQSLREVTAAIAHNPNMASYHVLQGRVLMEQHRLQSALESFANAESVQPDNADAAYYTGIAYQRWSNDEKALEAYTRASQRDENNVQYLLAAGESLVALDRLEEAQERIEARLAHFENNAAMRHLLAQIASLQGDHTRAAQLYREARLLRPEDDALIEELAWAQYAAGEYGQCHSTVTQLQQRTGEARADLMHLSARCLALTERVPEARNLYLELTRAKPNDAEVWVELGMLCWDLGDYRRVAQCSVQAIALAPTRYEGYLLKGVNERHRGNWDNAVSLFRQSTERTTTEALPFVLLGLTLEQSGERADALIAYNDALAVDAENAQAQALLNRLQESTRITVVEDSADESQ